jgi:hypothetical protein
MNTRMLAVAALGLAALLPSCGGSSQPAGPTAAASPTPSPGPTPTPTLGNPMASVTAKMFGYTRNDGPEAGQGRYTIPPAPDFFIPADWIDLDCTPRDADGRETSNHPDTAEWYGSQGGDGKLVENVDYVWEDGASYDPQVQLRYSARSGYIDVYCKVGQFVSNTVRIVVHGND